MTTSLLVRHNSHLSQYDEDRMRSILERITETLRKKIHHDLIILFEYGKEWKNTWEDSMNLHHQNSMLMVFMTSELAFDSKFREEILSFINYRPQAIIMIEYQHYHRNSFAKLFPASPKFITLDWTKQRFISIDDPFFNDQIEKIGSAILEIMESSNINSQHNTSPKITFSKSKSSHFSKQKPDHRKVKKHLSPLVTDFSRNKKNSYSSVFVKNSSNVITMTNDGTGDFPTLVDAVKKCPDNGTIILKPGIYLENIIISRPIKIIGEGDVDDIEIRSSGSCNFLIDSDCILKNFTIRQFGGIDWYAIDIRGPYNVEIDRCHIQSDCNSCIAIHNEANPYIHHCFIHDSVDGSGIFIYDRGRGRIENNKITWNKHAGIEIKTQGDPIIRFNKINDSYGGGILVYGGGRGIIEENEIIDSSFAGIQIEEYSDPIIRKNLILSGKQSGIYIKDNGRGLIEDNDISSNSFAGIAVETGSYPIVQSNRIHLNNYGIWVYNNGSGSYECNDLQGNKTSSWLLQGNAHIDMVNNIDDS
ncbi:MULTISPECIES: right-handed parallel beta-helix repeat-containing protein [Candidatus Ichthyocystis]|uniref:Right handed beta helix domain-containing protein n=1 Tax=Candidatus Ichthyocystis hellenicum TaxID=1561003 RepID=A0A0S4M2F9_9BURK|nr:MULTISPECIES: right-handed parallel beta-helix repeat-containing protein [Ichthyocystis]CUT16938.1 hypothetical protein, beta helix domain [Candidatus Ichthyocystis hellenicum]